MELRTKACTLHHIEILFRFKNQHQNTNISQVWAPIPTNITQVGKSGMGPRLCISVKFPAMLGLQVRDHVLGLIPGFPLLHSASPPCFASFFPVPASKYEPMTA